MKGHCIYRVKDRQEKANSGAREIRLLSEGRERGGGGGIEEEAECEQ